MKLNVKINGKKLDLEVNPNAMLIDVLRDAGFKSVKNGCSEGSCGACAVMIDGRPKNFMHYSRRSSSRLRNLNG